MSGPYFVCFLSYFGYPTRNLRLLMAPNMKYGSTSFTHRHFLPGHGHIFRTKLRTWKLAKVSRNSQIYISEFMNLLMEWPFQIYWEQCTLFYTQISQPFPWWKQTGSMKKYNWNLKWMRNLNNIKANPRNQNIEWTIQKSLER